VKQEAAGQTVATEDKAAHKATEVKGTIKEGVGRDVTIANGRSASWSSTARSILLRPRALRP